MRDKRGRAAAKEEEEECPRNMDARTVPDVTRVVLVHQGEREREREKS